MYREALIVTDRILELTPEEEDILRIREELMKRDKPKKGIIDRFFK